MKPEGLDSLAARWAGRSVAIVGSPGSESDLRGWSAHFPQATYVSSAGLRRPFSSHGVLLVDDSARAQLAALRIPARERYRFWAGLVVPLRAAPLLAEGWARLERRYLDGRFGQAWAELRGADHPSDNDHRFIEEAMAGLAAGWPALAASVVLPVYNRRDYLDKTLAAFLHQRYPRRLFEIIIADDGSADDPGALASKYPELSIRVVRQADEGFRLAAIRNRGIEAARGEVVLLLDCDMLPEPEWLSSMMKPFHVCPKPLLAIGHRTFVNADRLSAEDIARSFDVACGLPSAAAPPETRSPFRREDDWRLPRYRMTQNLRHCSVPYRFASGGNLAFRRAFARACGGYDEGYRTWGGEDVEFAYRAYRMGAYFLPCLAARALHLEHPRSTSGAPSPSVDRTRQRVPHPRSYGRPGESFERPLLSVVWRGEPARRADLEGAMDAQAFSDWRIEPASSADLVRALGALAPAYPDGGEYILACDAVPDWAPEDLGAWVWQMTQAPHPRGLRVTDRAGRAFVLWRARDWAQRAWL